MFLELFVPKVLSSRIYVPPALCSCSFMFQRVYFLGSLRFHIYVFPDLSVLEALYSRIYIFTGALYAPAALCPRSSKFLELHIFGAFCFRSSFLPNLGSHSSVFPNFFYVLEALCYEALHSQISLSSVFLDIHFTRALCSRSSLCS